MTIDTRAGRIRQALSETFQPLILEIIDESARHAGHAGSSDEGETHFFVKIVSKDFTGCSRLERSRLVYQALTGELKTGLHALTMELRSPNEG